MPNPARKSASLEALRLEIAQRFRGAVPGSLEQIGEALGSGLPEIDALFPQGGLSLGESLRVDCPRGSGGLSLLSAWARESSRANEPVAVIDTSRGALPHPWVEPEIERGQPAPIWVITPMPMEAWAALDIVLRSRAFGLVILLDAPPPPRQVGARLTALLRRRPARLIVRGRAPLRPTYTLSVRIRRVTWVEAPIGSAPLTRQLTVERTDPHGRTVFAPVEITDAPFYTDRSRLQARARDRRPKHRGQGQARDHAKGRRQKHILRRGP